MCVCVVALLVEYLPDWPAGPAGQTRRRIAQHGGGAAGHPSHEGSACQPACRPLALRCWVMFTWTQRNSECAAVTLHCAPAALYSQAYKGWWKHFMFECWFSVGCFCCSLLLGKPASVIGLATLYAWLYLGFLHHWIYPIGVRIECELPLGLRGLSQSIDSIPTSASVCVCLTILNCVLIAHCSGCVHVIISEGDNQVRILKLAALLCTSMHLYACAFWKVQVSLAPRAYLDD